MNRALFFILAFCPAVATAATYDDLLARQEQISVDQISKPGRAYVGSAASVCASLGFSRVVSSVSERCTTGELLFFRDSAGGAVGELESNRAGDVVCGKMGYSKRLVSVVCAK